MDVPWYEVRKTIEKLVTQVLMTARDISHEQAQARRDAAAIIAEAVRVGQGR